MTLSISLSPAIEARLREKAAASGQPLDVYATKLLEHAATSLSIEEVLAPVRRQVAQSGLTDPELEAFIEDVREEAFQERQRR